MALTSDLGSGVSSVFALAPNTVTAGGAGDGVAQNGPAIDRRGFYTAVVAVPVEATLGAGETATISVAVETRADSSAAWEAFASASDVVLDASGSDAAELNLDLSGASAEVRAIVTPTLSAGTTDTAAIAAAMILAGAKEVPV